MYEICGDGKNTFSYLSDVTAFGFWVMHSRVLHSEKCSTARTSAAEKILVD